MATSSFFHNVNLTTPKQAKAFIRALEKSALQARYEKPKTHTSRDMTPEEISKLYMDFCERKQRENEQSH